MDHAPVRAWIDTYERAWRTAGTDTLAALFTDDATYSMEPYDTPARGLDAIAALWERERQGCDEVFTMSAQIVAAEGNTAVARVEVRYQRNQQQYRDLWIMRFAPDGRCAAFEEWPFWPQKGTLSAEHTPKEGP
ncbi:MAG: YybH family protein [Actinomycetota bacterium]